MDLLVSLFTKIPGYLVAHPVVGVAVGLAALASVAGVVRLYRKGL